MESKEGSAQQGVDVHSPESEFQPQVVHQHQQEEEHLRQQERDASHPPEFQGSQEQQPVSREADNEQRSSSSSSSSSPSLSSSASASSSSSSSSSSSLQPAHILEVPQHIRTVADVKIIAQEFHDDYLLNNASEIKYCLTLLPAATTPLTRKAVIHSLVLLNCIREKVADNPIGWIWIMNEIEDSFHKREEDGFGRLYTYLYTTLINPSRYLFMKQTQEGEWKDVEIDKKTVAIMMNSILTIMNGHESSLGLAQSLANRMLSDPRIPLENPRQVTLVLRWLLLCTGRKCICDYKAQDIAASFLARSWRGSVADIWEPIIRAHVLNVISENSADWKGLKIAMAKICNDSTLPKELQIELTELWKFHCQKWLQVSEESRI